MKTILHFSNTEAPQSVREKVQTWIEHDLEDLEPRHDLEIKMFCSREGRKSNSNRFKCLLQAKAPWMSKIVSVQSKGRECWDTIVDCSHKLRYQISKMKKLKTTLRRRIRPANTISSLSDVELTG